MKERLSLAMLFNNVTRWYNAGERPHASTERHFESLDTLLPDGSILWSAEHMAIFTPNAPTPKPKPLPIAAATTHRSVDPKGVAAFDKLLAFLKAKGVQVVLVHPPFNPHFYDAVQGGTYMAGLDKIREITRSLAAKHGLNIIGDFDPHVSAAPLRCTSTPSTAIRPAFRRSSTNTSDPASTSPHRDEGPELMVFSSYQFIFVFLPLTYLAFLLALSLAGWPWRDPCSGRRVAGLLCHVGLDAVLPFCLSRWSSTISWAT